MKVMVFGATGMIGKGTLLEALDDAEVDSVVAVVRSTLDVTHPKLTVLAHKDFTDFSAVDFKGVDAVLWCLGVSSAGMNEADYTRVTYDYAVAAARAVAAQAPAARFCFVSGQSTDVNSRQMWARVKGRTELEVQRIFGARAFCFRPGFIEPLRGVAPSSTPWLRAFYTLLRPLFPLVRRNKRIATTSVVLGRALVRVGKTGLAPKPILESVDINAL